MGGGGDFTVHSTQHCRHPTRPSILSVTVFSEHRHHDLSLSRDPPHTVQRPGWRICGGVHSGRANGTSGAGAGVGAGPEHGGGSTPPVAEAASAAGGPPERGAMSKSEGDEHERRGVARPRDGRPQVARTPITHMEDCFREKSRESEFGINSHFTLHSRYSPG